MHLFLGIERGEKKFFLKKIGNQLLVPNQIWRSGHRSNGGKFDIHFMKLLHATS